MLRIAVSAATFALMSSSSLADFTVYQGRSGHVLGTCSTSIECKAILGKHQGYGESIVDNATGVEVDAPGRSDFGHAQGNSNGQGNHGQGNNGRGH